MGLTGDTGVIGATGSTGPTGSFDLAESAWAMKWSGSVTADPSGTSASLADDVRSVGTENTSVDPTARRRYPFCGTHTTTCMRVRTESSSLAGSTATINLVKSDMIIVGVMAPPPGMTVTVPVVTTFTDLDDIEIIVDTSDSETAAGTIDLEVVVEFQGPRGPTGPTGAAGLSSGAYLGRQVFTASGTYTPTPGTRHAIFRIIGGGGGGGGAGPAPGGTAVGGGGSAGTLSEDTVFAPGGITGGPVVVGTGGVGGTNVGGNGADGGNTTVVIQGILRISGGGGGGRGQAATPTPSFANGGEIPLGGAGDAVSGMYGLNGIALAPGVGRGGNGGSNAASTGGRGARISSFGAIGNGPGAGGGGALSIDATGSVGGSGRDGEVIIDEFS